jgi:hypothetical protein
MVGHYISQKDAYYAVKLLKSSNLKIGWGGNSSQQTSNDIERQ